MNRTHKLLLKTLLFFVSLTIVLYPILFFILEDVVLRYVMTLLISMTLSGIFSTVFFFYIDQQTPEETPLIETV